ncbi:MAG TPA: FAD-dependent oxidoreductase [Candidatus Dormibacteraeota bacterium]|nr:FAD-dependent oxidoreductase [Candidatus Dormibacteraeota bacterium]
MTGPERLTVYGAPWCPDCRRAKQFLSEHRVDYRWVNIDEDADGLRTVEEIQKGGRTIPTIVFPDQTVLLEPTNEALAQKLGLRLQAERAFYDLAIVGGGPAGLAAAIYAAREGIQALVVDRSALGGQAGVTERIDNYPGFPDGIGGAELARRFVAQAERYGVENLGAVEVTAVARDGDDVVLTFGSGQQVGAHAALLAPGSSYRRLGVPGEEALIGAGVHFCATCDGPFYRGADELLVIGGGNSGIEEGFFLGQFAKKIRVVQRDDRLTASPLLQDKVRSDPRFEVHLGTEIVELRGQGKVEEVVGRTRATGELHHWRPQAVFVYIGLDPNTQFLDGTVELDPAGFIVADGMFRTSVEGIFAAGDGRAGSTKQLGAAVGDGIAALIAIRGYLQGHSHLTPRSSAP